MIGGGRISGSIVEADTNKPLGSILVSCAGEMDMTDGWGKFTFDHIPEGIQNLVAISPDGAYDPFQQGARVSNDAITTAHITMQAAHWVNVTFLSSPPADMPLNAPPIRMVGNLLALGNTFTVLPGGVTIDPLKAPPLIKQADGQYVLNLNLPDGFDLKYKYTMGDGFWNAEHTKNGRIMTREMIVPGHDVIIKDQINMWGIPELSPVDFKITVPDNTPASNQVAIQFAPFNWMEPVPMWSTTNNRWYITIFPPMAGLSAINYQFCHNHTCGIRNDLTSSPPDPALVGSFTFASVPQMITYQINNWAWWENPTKSVNITSADINPRGSQFIAAVEFSPNYSQDQITNFRESIRSIKQLGANWVFITPQWRWQKNSSLAVKNPDVSLYENDLKNISAISRQNKLSVAYFPIISYPILSTDWWEKSVRDSPWWEAWFNSYQAFIMDQAAQAEKNQIQALIMGGPAVTPALPNGHLRNGDPSGVFNDSLEKWQKLIIQVRNVYHGPLIWAVTNEDVSILPPEIISDVNGFYLLYSAAIVDNHNAIKNRDLDNAVDVLNSYHKPVILGFEYPSTLNAAHGCRWRYDSNCWGEDLSRERVDLSQQFATYESLLNSVNQNATISGFVSRGFNLDGPSLDTSPSINGKPASALIWYWYPRLTITR